MTTSRWASGPTLFTLPQLIGLTRQVADELRAGRHAVTIDPERRWYRLLRSDGYADVWLISWSNEQSTELHDHGGSLGALTVVRGTLTERRWSPLHTEVRERSLRVDASAGFDLGHVHDVSNTGAAPAVSVHAYAPPLTAMSYYRVERHGGLRRTRTVLVGDDSEGRRSAARWPA